VGIILDTSILVAVERGQHSLAQLLEPFADEPTGIAAITASELLHGVYRAKDAGVRARRAAVIERLLARIPVYEFGLVEARRHAELNAELRAKGEPIGAHDLLIAATAVARGDLLCTMNESEFARVSGLRVLAVRAG
jgi:tRNA(fMet)-specific endonuclease VapC